MIRSTLLVVVACLVPQLVIAEATKPGTYYVTTLTLNVRLAPDANARITNKLHRQQLVEVYEVRNGWARISRYYDGEVEGLTGQVAEWVAARYLSTYRPPDLPQPQLPQDPRIQGLPKVGESGLTERDVRILYRAAHHFLQTGRCQKIEYGDKSVHRPNTYYLNCGEPRNLFFQPSDIPE